jgi:hypothetical protein
MTVREDVDTTRRSLTAMIRHFNVHVHGEDPTATEAARAADARAVRGDIQDVMQVGAIMLDSVLSMITRQ